LFFLYLSAQILIGSILHVPGTYPTIQTAINASIPGDTVLVAVGTYSENIRFLGKAITVISEDGSEETIIDGSNPSHPDSASVMSFIDGEESDSILEGFTVTGGTGTKSGDNRMGGGILIIGSSPTISMNFVTGNSVASIQNSYGGGILCTASSNPEINGNTITGNTAFSTDGNGYGGGICYTYESSPEITCNIILQNTSELGGGVYGKHTSQAVILNNVICQNEAFLGGGITCNPGSEPVIRNNVVCDNTAYLEGGGIRARVSTVTVSNCIIRGNSAPQGCQIWVGDATSPPAYLFIEYTNVEYGQDSVWVGSGSSLEWGEGNTDENPLFETGSLSGYQLSEGSPCIDSGNPDALYNDPEDPLNPGYALWPALETITNDMGAYGGDGAGYWTGIDEEDLPSAGNGFSLLISPNPMSGCAVASFVLLESGWIAVEIFDISGRQVIEQDEQFLLSGLHTVALDTSSFPGGIYFLRIRASERASASSFIVIR